MFSAFNFFEKQYDRYLRIDFAIDARMRPYKLIQSLEEEGNKKSFIKCMTKKTNNGFKILRRLTTAHLLIMNSNEFYEVVEQFIATPFDSTDQWLNQQCIRTYYHFLKKVTASCELYAVTKQFSAIQVSFENIFYLIHLITDMFNIVQKMPLLGRYFKNTNQIVTSSFVQTIAVQAQKIYTVIKSSLQQILSNHKILIKSRDDQRVMKAILEESLPFINQEMKKLFLDKYFYPYGKGIGIRLFRPEQQPQTTLKIINGIISDHKDTERKNYQQDLEKTLFPEDGKVNFQFYQKTLKPSQNKNQEVIIRDLDQIEQQIQIVIPTEFDQTTVTEQKIQKQTSHHLQIVHDV